VCASKRVRCCGVVIAATAAVWRALVVLPTVCGCGADALCWPQQVLVLHGGLFSQDGVTLDDLRRLDRNR
jgi:hypothetical protein